MRTTIVPLLLASILAVSAGVVHAEDAVTLSVTIKDHQFEPAEVHAPAGQPIAIRVKNLQSIAAEFESSELHFEKVIVPGGEAIVHVRPQQPGRYNFFDDFHHQTQGFLVVP
jgi:heme/copper-type cytochrome/quinol oxidase subunit 2